MTQHATVQREGFTVPMIGIPADAVLEECADCHDLFPLSEITLEADGFCRCQKCKTDATLARLDAKLEKRVMAIRESERITEEDLQIIVT